MSFSFVTQEKLFWDKRVIDNKNGWQEFKMKEITATFSPAYNISAKTESRWGEEKVLLCLVGLY